MDYRLMLAYGMPIHILFRNIWHLSAGQETWASVRIAGGESISWPLSTILVMLFVGNDMTETEWWKPDSLRSLECKVSVACSIAHAYKYLDHIQDVAISSIRLSSPRTYLFVCKWRIVEPFSWLCKAVMYWKENWQPIMKHLGTSTNFIVKGLCYSALLGRADALRVFCTGPPFLIFWITKSITSERHWAYVSIYKLELWYDNRSSSVSKN